MAADRSELTSQALAANGQLAQFLEQDNERDFNLLIKLREVLRFITWSDNSTGRALDLLAAVNTQLGEEA